MFRHEGSPAAEITWEDLLRMLEEHPEWLERVREVVLTHDLLSLPEVVRKLVGAQYQTTLQIQELREAQYQTSLQIQELREAQYQTGLQIQGLVEAQHETALQIQELREAQYQTGLQIQGLVEVLKQTNSHIRGLEAAVSGLLESVKAMAESLRTLSSDIARMKGFSLEMQYRQKAHAYFGRLLRSVRVMTPMDLEDLLEQHLTPDEVEDLLPLDLIVAGRIRRHPRQPEVMLAMEVSFTVDKEDIRRARERALLLRKAGLPALPAAAGVYIPPEMREIAQAERVVVFEDGRVFLWDEIIQEFLGE